MAYSLMGQAFQQKTSLANPGRPQPAGGLNIPSQNPPDTLNLPNTQPSTLTLPNQPPQQQNVTLPGQPPAPSGMAQSMYDRMLMNGIPTSVDEAMARPGMEQRIAAGRQRIENDFAEANRIGQQYGVTSPQQQSQALQVYRQLRSQGRFNGSLEDYMRARFDPTSPTYGSVGGRYAGIVAGDTSQPQTRTATSASPFVTAEQSRTATSASPFVTAETGPTLKGGQGAPGGADTSFGVNPGNQPGTTNLASLLQGRTQQPTLQNFTEGGFTGGNGATVQPQNTGSAGPINGTGTFTGGGFTGGNGATVQPQGQQGLDPYRFMEGLRINAGNIPGQTDDPRSLSGLRDLSTNYLNLLGDRDLTEFGGGNLGGNNIGPDGEFRIPDWMRNSAARYGEADTNAATRQVGEGELVENRLGRLMRGDHELNRIAQENALEQAAARGMLGSGVAAGAALRASREAMMPIAQQDAQTEFNTASQNMDATNRDRLADQQNQTGLLSQEIGTAANLLDSASGRRWQSRENNTQNAFQLMRDELEGRRGMYERQQDRDFNRSERIDTQAFQNMDRDTRLQFEAGQNDAERSLRERLQEQDQQFRGDQGERDRQQQRTMAYYETIYGREGMLAQTLGGIYSNPNLTAAQQQAAARQAQDFFRSLWESSNQTLSGGIPDIFADPYRQPPPEGEEGGEGG